MESQYINCNCRYKDIFNNEHSPMLIIDPINGAIIDANYAASNYYKYSVEDLLTKNISDINVSTKYEVSKDLENANKEDRVFFRLKHKLSTGEIRHVEVYSGPLQIGNRNMLFSIIHDTKLLVKLEKDYIIKKANFDGLFNNSPEAIAIVDTDFRVLSINESFENLFQYSLSEIENMDITALLVQKNNYRESYQYREFIINGEFFKKKLKRIRKDGEIIDVQLLGFPLVVEGATIGAYLIYSDLSESIEKEKQIQMLTYKDHLTGLFNRESFLDIVEEEILTNNTYYNYRDKDKFAVVVIGINELNEINDALGHLTGDEVLEAFSWRLKEYLRPQDTLSRYSEDEFAILVYTIGSIHELDILTQEIFNGINSIYYIRNNELHITATMGISIYPDDGTDSITLVRKADIAMNKSKIFNSRKANRFDIKQDQELQEYFWMKNDLAKAIEKSELFINYQPIYDSVSNNVVGTEALLRWRYQGNRIISPDKFIPIAEKTGLIIPIGEWVLLNACKQNKKWQDLGYEPVYISVNVSVIQLEQPCFYQKVIDILKEAQLDPKYLQLEVTETFFTQNLELIEKTIKEISGIGVKLAIDDFGTGYSSLGQLLELKINNLKIDKSFIDGVDRNINKTKIVKAVISLAESLNINLTAEGVETQEELDFLMKNRCTIAQGYLFSRPVEPNVIENLLVKCTK